MHDFEILSPNSVQTILTTNRLLDVFFVQDYNFRVGRPTEYGQALIHYESLCFKSAYSGKKAELEIVWNWFITSRHGACLRRKHVLKCSITNLSRRATQITVLSTNHFSQPWQPKWTLWPAAKCNFLIRVVQKIFSNFSWCNSSFYEDSLVCLQLRNKSAFERVRARFMNFICR